MRSASFIACAAVLLIGGAANAGLGGALPWNGDHKAGLDEAGKTGKPVVIYFTADW